MSRGERPRSVALPWNALYQGSALLFARSLDRSSARIPNADVSVSDLLHFKLTLARPPEVDGYVRPATNLLARRAGICCARSVALLVVCPNAVASRINDIKETAMRKLAPQQESLALLTDLYQLTMSFGYWKLKRSEEEAVFHLFFRKPPFRGEYAVAAGLASALEFLQHFRFSQSDLQYLAQLKGNDDEALFESAFLDYLGDLRCSCDVDAMPEGTLAFGHEPILRVRGPILQCQLLETALLNIINFQTLVATKASRICAATDSEPVLEFGLRRAQGVDGGLSASRAAYLGGCAATSNVLAGKLYGIPVKGTHAHSWVMSFDSELESFEAYANAMPNNCVFLVDTYDTLEGVRKAVEVGKRLKERGYKMVGIRLDSGDLALLSIQAREILDSAGFQDAAIVASNDLDEEVIRSLKQQGATIAVWGVGTKLATAFDQPALGGVYKLGALKNEQGQWTPKIKKSEQAIKTSIPGVLQVRRFLHQGKLLKDVIYNELQGFDARQTHFDLKQPLSPIKHPAEEYRDLLQPVMRGGEVVGQRPSLDDSRQLCAEQLTELDLTVQRTLNPTPFPVGLEIGLHELRQSMMSLE